MSASSQRSFRSTLALPLLAVALPAALSLTGCGSSSSSTPPTTSTLAASAVPGSTTSSTTTANTTANTNASSIVPSTVASSASSTPAGASVLDLSDQGSVAFASPSGRIQCEYMADAGAEVRCDVEQAHWTPAPGTAKCDLDEGDSVFLPTAGRAELTCHGDTLMGVATVGHDGTGWHNRPGAITANWNGKKVAAVAYGTTLRLPGGLRCTSHASGMECSNGNGHSFTVSQQGYRAS